MFLVNIFLRFLFWKSSTRTLPNSLSLSLYLSLHFPHHLLPRSPSVQFSDPVNCNLVCLVSELPDRRRQEEQKDGEEGEVSQLISGLH